jgi:hypothetical protein
MHYCQQRSVHSYSELKLNGRCIPVVDKVKFVYMMFDRKLTFVLHTQYLKELFKKGAEYTTSHEPYRLGRRQHTPSKFVQVARMFEAGLQQRVLRLGMRLIPAGCRQRAECCFANVSLGISCNSSSKSACRGREVSAGIKVGQLTL